jgi:hypothetical protein
MPKPLALSDDELSAVLAAARPIAVERRDAFLQQIASTLSNCAEISPGLVHRVCAEVQRKFFVPPTMAVGTAGRTSKYR